MHNFWYAKKCHSFILLLTQPPQQNAEALPASWGFSSFLYPSGGPVSSRVNGSGIRLPSWSYSALLVDLGNRAQKTLYVADEKNESFVLHKPYSVLCFQWYCTFSSSWDNWFFRCCKTVVAVSTTFIETRGLISGLEYVTACFACS